MESDLGISVWIFGPLGCAFYKNGEKYYLVKYSSDYKIIESTEEEFCSIYNIGIECECYNMESLNKDLIVNILNSSTIQHRSLYFFLNGLDKELPLENKIKSIKRCQHHLSNKPVHNFVRSRVLSVGIPEEVNVRDAFDLAINNGCEFVAEIYLDLYNHNFLIRELQKECEEQLLIRNYCYNFIQKVKQLIIKENDFVVLIDLINKKELNKDIIDLKIFNIVNQKKQILNEGTNDFNDNREINKELLAVKCDRWIKKGNNRYRKNKIDEAIEYYNIVLSYDPSNIKALNNKICALDVLGNHREVSIMFKNVDVKKYDVITKSYLFNNIACNLFILNQNDAAKVYFKNALANNNSDDEIMYNCGLTRFEEKYYDEALDYFETSIKTNKNNYLSWLYRGITLFYQLRMSEALESLQNAHKIRINSVLPLYWQGCIHLEEKKYSEAIKYFEYILEKKNGYKKALEKIALAYEGLGLSEQAQKYYRQITKGNIDLSIQEEAELLV